MSDTMTPIAEESLKLHYAKRGKIEVISTVRVQDKNDLSLAYTPGVAQPCLEIQKDVDKSYELTRRWNMCLVATDGSAVLGLGDIGPEAGMPVMEGKCVLFKEFGGWTRSHCASRATTWTRSCAPSSSSPGPSGA